MVGDIGSVQVGYNINRAIIINECEASLYNVNARLQFVSKYITLINGSCATLDNALNVGGFL